MSLFEHRVKTDLFIRHSRGIELTTQGERLHTFAKKMIHEAEVFEKSFHENIDEVEGELKIMTTPHLGSEWLLPKLKKFGEDYPKIKIKIMLRNGKDIVVEEADIGISSAIPHAPHLIQEYLFSANIALFASKEYLEKHGTPQTVNDLDHHQLITYGGNTFNPYGNKSWVLSLGKGLNEPSRKSHLEVNSLQELIKSTLLGMGIIEAPNDQSVLNFPELIRVLPRKRGPLLKIYYVFSQRRKNSKKIKLLLEYLKEN
jgi:DNA-binding transcriptional LysR family regulator